MTKRLIISCIIDCLRSIEQCYPSSRSCNPPHVSSSEGVACMVDRERNEVFDLGISAFETPRNLYPEMKMKHSTEVKPKRGVTNGHQKDCIRRSLAA